MRQAQTVTLESEVLDDTCLLSFPALGQVPGFAHAVTTRPWNMATHRGPQASEAAGRRRRVCERLGLSFERLTAPQQIHSGHVLPILAGDVGDGRNDHQKALPFVDGMVCDMPGVGLMQFSADCPIIIAVAPQGRVLGTAHASWRGTVAGIATELVRQLVGEFRIEPADLVVGICPCAGPNAYRVGEDVFRIARARWPEAEEYFPTADGQRCFDLRAANVAQLIGAGIRPGRISVAKECTIGDRRFFSHRRDGAGTGRFALIAGFP